MTTPEVAQQYLLEHLAKQEGKGWALYNPLGKKLEELPIIYGFNNGGPFEVLSAFLIAEDGTDLGEQICSDEGYMLHDLGILEGTQPDRHKRFEKHYPDGYRMEFVKYEDFNNNEGLKEACRKGGEEFNQR